MSTPFSSSEQKLKTYSVLLSSSLAEIRQLQNNSNVPKILEKENSSAIQNALDAQAKEIEHLREENKILENLLHNSPNQSNVDTKNLSDLIISKSNSFSAHFNQLIDNFNAIENEKLAILESQFFNLLRKRISVDDSSELTAEIEELKSINSTLLNENKELTSNRSQLIQSKQELEKHIQDQKQGYEEMIIQLQNQLQERNKQIQMLESEKSIETTNDHIISDLESKNSDLQNKIHQNNQIIENFNAQILKFETEKKELLDTIEHKTQEIQQIKSAFEKEMSTYQSQISTEFESVCTNKDSEINSLKSQLSQISNEYQSITKNKDLEIEALKNQLSILSSKNTEEGIENLTNHVKSLIETNSKLEADVERSHKLESEYKSEIKQLKESKSLLNNTILDLNARIEDLEVQINQAQNMALPQDNTEEIVLLKKALEETREKDSKQIQSLIQQVKDGLNLNNELKDKLEAIKKEKTGLQISIQKVQQNFEYAQFDNTEKEKKILHYQELLDAKELQISQLDSSYSTINESYQSLIGQNSLLKDEFDSFKNSFTKSLECEANPQTMLNKLNSIFDSLKSLKNLETVNQDMKRDMKLLRKQYNNKIMEYEDLQKQFQSMLERRQLSQNIDGQSLLNKYDSDFADLYTQHSNLIKEHNELNNKLFKYESTQQETNAKINDLTAINQQLTEKTENFDLYQFVTMHLIDLLSILSSSLISNSLLQNSPSHDQHLKIVDNLLVLLKTKEHISFDNLEMTWKQFSEIIQSLIATDQGEIIHNLSSRFNSIAQSAMTEIYEKISTMDSKFNEIDQKCKTLFSDDSFIHAYRDAVDTHKLRKTFSSTKQQPRLSLYERSLKSNQMAKTPNGKSKSALKMENFDLAKMNASKTPNKSSFVKYVNPLSRQFPSMRIDTPLD